MREIPSLTKQRSKLPFGKNAFTTIPRHQLKMANIAYVNFIGLYRISYIFLVFRQNRTTIFWPNPESKRTINEQLFW